MDEHGITIGERVFVGGTTGRYGTVRARCWTWDGKTFYYVQLEGHVKHSGPFEDVWAA